MCVCVWVGGGSDCIRISRKHSMKYETVPHSRLIQVCLGSPKCLMNIPWCSPVCSFHCLPDVLPIPLRDLSHDLPRRVHDRSGIGSIWTPLSSTDIHLKGTVNAEEGGRGGGRREEKKDRWKRGGERERSRKGAEGSSQAINLDTDSCMKRHEGYTYSTCNVHTWEPSLHPPPW